MDPKIKLGIAAGIIALVAIASYAALLGSSVAQDNGATPVDQDRIATEVLRIGYFPNVNHAPAVIGLGRGDFQKALSDIEVKTQTFNAGPSAIEALFANQIDATFVGPNPAINGYVKSNGDLRIVAGASSGGAVFVVRKDAGINSVEDFAGKRFASPQLGNTQDVALRAYLLDHGYKTTDKGGNVEVLPVKNPDILTLLLKKEIDGAWVPEPWGALFLKEGNTKLFLDERDLWPEGKFVTVHLVVRTNYLKDNPDVIKKLIEANVDETIWMNNHKEEALRVLNAEIEKLTGAKVPEDELKDAFSRLDITYDPISDSLIESANDAFNLGFLGEKRPDLSEIYDLTLLNEVLKEKGLAPIT
ncbi:MAG: NitT/TauT family transport system substrate-binding protein [Candidatus Nitrosomirales archaeon]|jgi:NitT/TauT family transport system substrate-binding protein